jgi:outer membrane receptor for ferrienterochelin and colicins
MHINLYRNLIFWLAVAAATLTAQFATAQCDLVRAQGYYFSGQFAELKMELNACFQNNRLFSKYQQSQAHYLLALVAIAEDSTDLAKFHIKNLLVKDPDFKAEPHLVFDQLYRELSESTLRVKVNSVSKHPEDLITAPAQITLVTREEILDRGYLDIVEVLMDLPGFDISRTFVKGHANVYQLGFLQEYTQLTLLMVNGVEENDAWSNIAYLSRQYPISMIKAVEVIYGPSSTIYGPRAFLGAVNIITLDPGEKPAAYFDRSREVAREDNAFNMHAQIAGASLGTYNADLNIGYKRPQFQFSLTARAYRSREDDFSEFPYFDNNPSDIDSMNYDHLNLRSTFVIPEILGGGVLNVNLEDYITAFNIDTLNPYISLMRSSTGRLDSIMLTPLGLSRAKELDRQAYTGDVNGAPRRFSNDQEDYFVGLRFAFSNFTIGIQHWRSGQSMSQYQDLHNTGVRNGSVWMPRNTTFYSKYDRDFKNFSVSNFTSFHDHSLDKRTVEVEYLPFGSLLSGLHIAHLINPDSIYISIFLNDIVKHGHRNIFRYYQARSFRNDFRLFINTDKWSMSNGLELRSSAMQGDYLFYFDLDTDKPIDQKGVALAQERGIVFGNNPGGNQYNTFDLGMYTHSTYKIIPQKLFLTAGMRMDYNRIRVSEGFGFDFSPKLALVWTSPWITLKGVTAQGLQNVSHEAKFASERNLLTNGDLKTEKIRYFALSASGASNSKKWNWELVTYLGDLQGISRRVVIDGSSIQQRNEGEFLTQGAMFSTQLKVLDNRLKFFGNFSFFNTYERLEDSTSVQKIRMGGIAPLHANLGISARVHPGAFRTNFDIRANYVSQRPFGPNTTLPDHSGLNGSRRIPPYLIFDGNFVLGHQRFPQMRLALTAQNLLNNNIIDPNNQRYFHSGPGDGSASFISVDGFVPYIPQRNRYLIARLIFDI